MKSFNTIVENLRTINPRAKMLLAMTPIIVCTGLITGVMDTKIERCSSATNDVTRVVAYISGGCVGSTTHVATLQ